MPVVVAGLQVTALLGTLVRRAVLVLLAAAAVVAVAVMALGLPAQAEQAVAAVITPQA